MTTCLATLRRAASRSKILVIHNNQTFSTLAPSDPTPWLILSFEMKKEDALKPYDAKKSVWVPDGEGGFDEAMIDSVDGDKVNVKVGWEPKTFKSAQVMQVNPPKMEKVTWQDESNLSSILPKCLV